MLTPIFDITQDHEFVFIAIKAPNASVAETEIHFEDNDFRFFSKPYFLRLSLPSKVIENGEELAKYDSKTGTFLIKLSKLNIGEHFEGLDLLTKLLNNSNKKTTNKPLIQVINGDQTTSDANDCIEVIDEELDWSFDQTLRHESDDQLLFGEKYGFGNQQTGVIARLASDFADLIDIKDPEHKSLAQKRRERLELEETHFSDDHYLCDMFDEHEVISNVIAFETHWNKCWNKCVDQCLPLYQFNDEEKFKLKNLPNKEFILEKSMKKSLLLGMIDILFAYAYDRRINECEHSVESAWNICKVSGTLSWFETYTSLTEVIISCIRRSLCYPLYRNWRLSLQVLEDVKKIIKMGQNYIIKCFLDIHKLFNESGDGRYILNDLYITDYSIWLQYVKGSTFYSLSAALEVIQISKSDVNLDLDLLERAAFLAIEENAQQRNDINISKDSSTTRAHLENKIDNYNKGRIHEMSSESSSYSSDNSSLFKDCLKKESHLNDSFTETNDSNDSDDDSSSTDSDEDSRNIASIDKDFKICYI